MWLDARALLIVLLPTLLLLCHVHGLPKEMVISYRTCVDGEGCHIIEQTSFHDSHILLLTSTSYQRHLQGRLIDMGAGCPSPGHGHGNANSVTSVGSGPRKSKHNHQTIGLVQCGQCPLSDMLREAERIGASGVVVANTNECGRPTREFLESAAHIRVPVTFVASKVIKEIRSMQQRAEALKLDQPQPEGKTRRQAFVYVSILDDGLRRESNIVNHILASTHILLAAMVILALFVYLSLACSIGSLRYIPREIAPEIFGHRPEPIDKEVLEKLPLVPVEWNMGGFYDTDEESQYETPSCEINPETEAIQQQLAGIIVRCGEGAYSFTEENTCAISLDKYGHNELLRLLPCKHAFHQKCIDTWLLSDYMTTHCPICKSSIIDGLRILNKHGYSKILNLLYGTSNCEEESAYKPNNAFPLCIYYAIRDCAAKLWNRRT
ncbi:hypothetical protein COEREDRAFT_81063 [Coemansia reversa NRRL 1564]|uniref:RING-type domain-containing protein n=1 Tax=Coemansia reversa (strain ATCC 12441 / NRRL 1564) TaxID=763665 RepID=A0A2G5BCI0_COERN|nr:hypothetical protein COEREDRAFT_81063 [Coemansia reversa NRRL 1564]|eukprot:PIA16701.1 hypothetical protein COEREDRAFT_81063 [Coemansia reversa NRRL 1564]